MNPGQLLACPLVKFSFYTKIQSKIIIRLGDEIIGLSNKAFIENNAIDGSCFKEIYGKFWLWVIGAYEIIRTMCDPLKKSVWVEKKFRELNSYKLKLAEIRMPFAKQVLRGTNNPIYGENSVHGFDRENKDFIYKIKDKR